MDHFVSAVIGGIATVIGVLLSHYLQKRDMKDLMIQPQPPPPSVPEPTTLPEVRIVPMEQTPPKASPWRRVFASFGVLIADFIFIVLKSPHKSKEVTGSSTDHLSPTGEFICILLIPTFALYLLWSGLVRALAKESPLKKIITGGCLFPFALVLFVGVSTVFESEGVFEISLIFTIGVIPTYATYLILGGLISLMRKSRRV